MFGLQKNPACVPYANTTATLLLKSQRRRRRRRRKLKGILQALLRWKCLILTTTTTIRHKLLKPSDQPLCNRKNSKNSSSNSRVPWKLTIDSNLFLYILPLSYYIISRSFPRPSCLIHTFIFATCIMYFF